MNIYFIILYRIASRRIASHRIMFDFSPLNVIVREAIMSKQTTLFKYIFVKKIMHRGRLVNVTKSTASNKQDPQFPCVKCKKSFKRKGALWMHEKWCIQMTLNNAEKQISFSDVSSEKDAEDFGAIA